MTISPEGRSLRYRPDIDGLRALAVIAVIIYHAFPEAVHSGFIGVDVFFVISGFLISGILFANVRDGNVKILDFYRRRVSRIFPALIVVSVFCLAFGWAALFPKEFHQLGADVASGASFSENFSLMGEAGYFDRGADTKPLIHLWSLAIEEQFYLFWPLLIWGIWRLKQDWTLPLLGLTAASFGYNLYEAQVNHVVDFYAPLTRFWELGLGGVTAAYAVRRGPFWVARTMTANICSVAGLAVLALGVGLLSSEGYPGWQALLPVAGTALVIAAGPNAFINRNLLANGMFTAIGKISYPLYLWHWPLLVYARILEGQTPAPALRAAMVGLAFILAVATYYGIEKPVRFGGNAVRRAIVVFVAMVLVGAFGQDVFLRNGFAQREVVRINPKLASAAAGGAGASIIGACYVPVQARPRIDGCSMDARELPRYALIGDSKAGALSSGLFRTSFAGGRWLYMGNNDGKGTFLSTVLLARPDFPREYPLTRQMLDAVESHPSIRAVVIADAVRNMYQLGDDTSLQELPQTHNDDAIFTAFDAAVTELIAHGRRVYLVADNPALAHPEDCVGRLTSLPWVNHLLGLPSYPSSCSVPYRTFFDDTAKYRLLLARLSQRHAGRLKIIPTADIYCDEAANICPMFRHGRQLYGYTDHPSNYTAGLIGLRINRIVRADSAARFLAQPATR